MYVGDINWQQVQFVNNSDDKNLEWACFCSALARVIA